MDSSASPTSHLAVPSGPSTSQVGPKTTSEASHNSGTELPKPSRALQSAPTHHYPEHGCPDDVNLNVDYERVEFVVMDSSNLVSPFVPFNELPRLQPQQPNMKYACPVCRKEFYDKKDFRYHYMVHTGEKPNVCPFCPYRARQKSALRCHMKARHQQR